MRKELLEIPQRMRELREILEISSFEMANRLHISLDTYQKYESGETDIPISTLYDIAGILQIDFTELIARRAAPNEFLLYHTQRPRAWDICTSPAFVRPG